MKRESVYLGCIILMMAAISAVSAQEGAAAISAENKTAAECNISIPATNNTCIMPSTIILGSGNKIASFKKPAFVIGGGGENMMQRANEVRLPAETVMDLSRAINIESSKVPFAIGGDGRELLQLASDEVPAETIMDLSATVLPRYKIRNIN